MKTVLLGFAYFGWILTVIGTIAVVIDIQPMFGSKFTNNDVIAIALVSISSSGLWLVFNASERSK